MAACTIALRSARSAASRAHRRRRARSASLARDEQAGAAVVDDLAAPADVGRDDRQAHRRGFHRRAGEALAVRRQHVEVQRAVEVLDVVAKAEERARRPPRAAGDLVGASTRRPCRGRSARPRRTARCGVPVAQHARPRRTPRGSPSPRRAGRRRARRRRRSATPSAARGPCVARPASAGVEAPRSMPLPSSTSLPRGTRRRASVSRSSGFCTSSAWEQRRGDAFEPVDDAALRGGVVGLRVQPVHGVDDRGHAAARARRAGRRRRASGCGCARSSGRSARNSRRSSRSAARSRCGAHDRVACSKRDVADPRGLELGARTAPAPTRRPLRSRRAANASQLRPEEQLEADVGGGDVNESAERSRGRAPRTGAG